VAIISPESDRKPVTFWGDDGHFVLARIAQYYPLASSSLTFFVRFDERFMGYGNDKDQFFYRLNMLQYKFYVVPDAFVVHWNHNATRWSYNSEKYSSQRRWRTYFASVAEQRASLLTNAVIEGIKIYFKSL
jgi:hypothetical protein